MEGPAEWLCLSEATPCKAVLWLENREQKAKTDEVAGRRDSRRSVLWWSSSLSGVLRFEAGWWRQVVWYDATKLCGSCVLEPVRR